MAYRYDKLTFFFETKNPFSKTKYPELLNLVIEYINKRHLNQFKITGLFLKYLRQNFIKFFFILNH